jgi:DNA-binding HxlR family transcriptional regulator
MSLADQNNDLESSIRTPDLEILNLSAKLFEPHRILLLKSMLMGGPVEFRQLKFSFNLSDGSLYSHLRALQHEGLIMARKEIVDEKLRTGYELTTKGKSEFERFLSALSTLTRLDSK